jgi:2'-5' RNA ligase
VARLFIGVYPPPSVVDAMRALPRPDEPGVRWVPPEQLHVTIRFIGNAEVHDVAAVLDRLAPSLQPASVDLGPHVGRLGRNVVCVPARGLEALAGRVVDATAALGQPPDPRPFHGHVTLARLRRRAACGLTGAPFHATFAADRVHLVQSITRSEGADHTVVRSWDLTA